MEKIAHIVVSTHDSLHPIRGGGALRTLKIAEELKRRGHRVIIVAPTDGTGELSGIRTHWLHAPRKQRSQLLSLLKFNIRLKIRRPVAEVSTSVSARATSTGVW